VARLRLIAGTDGNLGSPQPSAERRVRLLRALRRLPADFALMDLGAGTQGPTLDYFLAADDAVVLLVPEPTSVENAYTFLRAAFYRRLSLAMVSCGARDLVDEAMDQRNERGIRTPLDLLREVESLDPALGARFAEVVRGFHPRLIVNGVRTAEDVKLGFSIRTVCRKYFGIETDYLGYVSHDDEVRRSVRERRPLLGGDPPSDAAMYLQRIARKLSGAASARAPVAAGAPA
jgi:flagellar biosynthesis protein FlhG